MGKTTRRDFIKQSGFTLLTIGVSGRAFLQHTNFAANSALTAGAALSDTGNILVVIQMAGGNDGLHTIIPISTSQYDLYQAKRPTLKVPQGQVLPLNADVGLHPKLTKFKSLYDASKLAVVQGVGYPNGNLSHFRSMDIWHTANPDKIEYYGWLGDYLDINFQDSTNPLLACSLGGGTLPRTLRASETPVPAIGGISSYQINTDSKFSPDRNNQLQAYLALNREARTEKDYYEQIRRVALDAYSTSTAVQASVSKYVADPSIVYPAGLGTNALRPCAQLIAADLGIRILYVTIGGFDTHQSEDANLAGQQANLLTQLSAAIDAFIADLNRLGKADKVVVMTWSEFGRRPQENTDKGTDHGKAAPLFIVGNRVKGGVVGTHPNLASLDNNGDLKYSIDFRSVYATLLERWLGVDSKAVLGASFPVLDFIQ